MNLSRAPGWLAALALSACLVGPPDPTTDAASDGAAGVICSLGSVYGDAPVIDPDDPVYTGGGWTQAEVSQAFSDARAGNTIAYRAYRAAHRYPSLLPCAFCSCGCDTLVDHQSAVDCFKDMHGFS